MDCIIQIKEYGCNIAEVKIPDDAKVYKWKADKLEVVSVTHFRDHPFLQEEEWLKTALFYDGSLLQYVNNQTEELYSIAIKLSSAFIFIKNQTYNLCLQAVKNHPITLAHVLDRTEELCLIAVEKYGMMLQYVKEQTEKICLEAVRCCGIALKYVKDQTEEICRIAVINDPDAFKFVKNQTPAVFTRSTA